MDDIPEYVPSPLESRISRLCEMRNKAEHDRVFGIYAKDYPSLAAVFPLKPEAGTEEMKQSSFLRTMKVLQLQLAGGGNFFNRHARPVQIRRELADLLACPFSFERTCWLPKPPLDPNAPDEENIVSKRTDQPVVGTEELSRARDLIADLMNMIGKLARQISSCESQRILRCRVALEGRPCLGDGLPREDAEKLADELVYCFDAIKAEIAVLPAFERVRLVRPKMPHHRPDIVIHGDPPSDMTPEECTRREREAAYKRLRNEYFALFPFTGLNFEHFDAVKQTLEAVEAMANALDRGKPTFDRGEDAFDYKTLGEVLSADFRIYYRRYFTDGDYDEDGTPYTYREQEDEVEDTPQQKAKNAVIAHIDHILSTSVALAAKCKSKTQSDWADLTALFAKRGGDFHSYSEIDDDQATVDLFAFLDGFCRARQRLYVDWENHNRTDIVEQPIPTCPKGPVIEGMEKSMARIRQAEELSLHYQSHGEAGLAPTDGRRKSLVRAQMTDLGVELVRDKGFTAPRAAQEVIRRVGDNSPFAYSPETQDSLRKEIARQCKEDGIRLPNQRT